MLIYTSPQQTKKLSASEQLQAHYQDTDRRLEQFRLSDHADLKNEEKRLGTPMTHNELIRRVEKLTGKTVWAEDSLRDRNVVGFYTKDKGEKKFLVAFDKGFMPEFSVILTDAADLPVKERRGWRTVVTRLLQQKALTWQQVTANFGDSSHQASDRWRFNTRDLRK